MQWSSHQQTLRLIRFLFRFSIQFSSISIPNFILATHCITVNPIAIVVFLGEYQFSTNPDCIGTDCNLPLVQTYVEEVKYHLGFNPSTFHNDVALMRMNQNVEYTNFIKPLCLPFDDVLKQFNHDGQTMTAAGWGENINKLI